MSITIKFRRGSSSDWTSNGSIILASGEPAYEFDTGRFKIGNGTTAWSGLPYAAIVPSGFLAGSGISISLGNNGSSATISSSGATISNFADNRILTSDGTSTGINGENNLTFNGSLLNVLGSGSFSSGLSVSGNILVNNTGVVLSSRDIIAGSGLVGGGNLSADRTLHVGQGDGITVGADSISVNNTVIRTTGIQFIYGQTVIDGGLFGSTSNDNNDIGIGVLNDENSQTFTVNGFGVVTLGSWEADTIAVNKGGTGQTIYSNGQLLIGSGTTLAKNTLTAGSNIQITNGSGSITIAATGLSVSGHTHTSSNITDFNSSVSGLLPVKDIIAGTGISVASSSGSYTISAFGVAAASASSLVTECDNKTGANLSKMTVVYVNGGHGNRPTIQKAIADTEVGSSKTYGLTASDINNNLTGNVISFGLLTDVNTDQFGVVEGTTLYLSPTISGAITTTKPTAPYHMVTVGKVIRNHVSQGIIAVNIQNGFELGELHNVATNGTSNGQFLQYNSSSGLWIPSTSGNFTSLSVNNTGVVVTSRSITPGSGLVGSSALDLSADRTLDVGQGDGISVGANAISVDSTVVRTTGTQTINGKKTFTDVIVGEDVNGNGNPPLQVSLGMGASSTDSALIVAYGDPPEPTFVINANGSIRNTVTIGDNNTAGSLIINSYPGQGTFADIGGSGERAQFYGRVEVYGSTTTPSGYAPLVIGTSGANVAVISGVWRASTIDSDKGGTGQTSYSNGQLLIGSGTSLAKNTLTAGSNIQITNGSGSITIAATGLSVSGHTHTSSNITDFNSSVSGLLPTVSNSGDNRILTSTGSSVGINAESNLTFDGTSLVVSGDARVDNLKLDGNTLSSTSGNIIISPSGNGALQRDSGGNSRGAYAVDWQTVRTSPTMVANGTNSVIGGGENNTASGGNASIIGGSNNVASNNNTTVCGGSTNTSSGANSVVGGGTLNVSSGTNSTVAGGYYNNSSGPNSTIAGGSNNTSSGDYSTTGGGYGNNSSGSGSTVGGGVANTSSGYRSTAGGGRLNQATGQYSAVGGGYGNTSSGNYGSVVGGGYGNSSSGYYSTIGGGRGNSSATNGATIGGGKNNDSNGGFSTVGGGYANTASGYYGSVVGGGYNNTSSGYSATVGGGRGNSASGYECTVGGGRNNTCSTQGGGDGASTIGGGRNNSASSYYNGSTVGGGVSNTASGYSGSTVGGGISNNATGDYSTVGGGNSNNVTGYYSTVGGGNSNSSGGQCNTIAGGQLNSTSSSYSTVSGGYSNTSSGNCSTVSGGGNNISSGTYSTIGGGLNNTNNGNYSTIPGGFEAKATRIGELSHAAGKFVNVGDAQHTILIARRSTTDATSNVVLTLDGGSPGGSNRLVLPAQTTWAFSIKLSAYNSTDNGGGWWIIRGGIRRNNSNGTALIGSLITENGVDSSLSSASVSVVADDTNEALEIRVTGVTSKSIRWLAVVDLAQVSFGTP